MRFHHTCNPCDTCDNTGVVNCDRCDSEGCMVCMNLGTMTCDMCDGQAKACDCHEAWEAEMERRWEERMGR